MGQDCIARAYELLELAFDIRCFLSIGACIIGLMYTTRLMEV